MNMFIHIIKYKLSSSIPTIHPIIIIELLFENQLL